MKAVFVINPTAGLGVRFDKTLKEINDISLETGCEVYVTKNRLDASRFVCDYVKENGEARFIACGGDGTYNEVINGVLKAGAGEVGVIPIGSGNDFCRNFGDRDDFLNIKNQIYCDTVKCDAIRYVLTDNGEKKQGYCANMINIGFDCAVADTTDIVKQKTIFSGSLAYFVSIFVNLVKKKTSYLKIEMDGKNRYEGELLLTSSANGCYCGGGLKTNPLARINDGFINVNIVKNVSRTKFLFVLPEYIGGTYTNKEKFRSIVSSEKCKSLKITPFKGKMRVSVDGEIVDADHIELNIVHNAYSFAVPSRVLSEAVNKR